MVPTCAQAAHVAVPWRPRGLRSPNGFITNWVWEAPVRDASAAPVVRCGNVPFCDPWASSLAYRDEGQTQRSALSM